MNDLVLEVLYKNVLTCPECGAKEHSEMNSLEISRIYECNSCKEIVQANDDKCCIYCQYGDAKCPTEQVKWN